ncbi:LPXTG cell wall anchor domain-containing protein [Streptococcus suis]
MNTKKLVKWGVALTSTLVLGGVVAPVGGQLLNAPSVVYAQEKTATANVVSYHPSGVLGQYQDIIPLGGSKTYTAPVFDGWEVYAAGAYSANFSWTVKGVDSVTLPEGFTEESVLVEFNYKPMQIRPTEQPTEQPVATPADQPVEKPISVLIGAISEVDGPLSHYYVTINPGETKTVETPKVDGYKLDQYTSPTYELTYDNALKQLNSAGFAWVQFWMIKDAAPEIPVDQPVEQPTETPAEQPVEKPITYRIHYFLNDVVENGGTPSYTDIAPYKEGVISKGETIVEVAPHIDGYAVAGNNTIPVTYDHVTGDNVWHDEDWYPTSYFFYDKIEVPKPTEKPATTPIDQPAEQPVEIKPVETLTAQPTETPAEKPVATPTEKPAEQPVSTPTDQPTEKPTATSFLAGNTASKAQPVVTTDKNSTPSTTAVKSEEVSQATAKTLPKTGDSSSMLLVLAGLSGLGLVATSRKRD